MESMEMFLEPARAFLRQIGAFLPKVLIAVVILVAGWVLAKAVKFAVEKGLRAINFHVVTEKAGIDGFLERGGVQTDTTAMLGLLFYWLAILAALMIAFNSLGLTYITDLVKQVVVFIPNVIVAILILAFGAYFSRFVGVALTAYCKSIEVADAELLGELAGYATMVFVVLIALDQVQVGGDIVRQSFLIVLAAVAFALALAFGLAGQKRAAHFLERHWPSAESDREPGGPARSK
jgi:Mechanosensitive ion channel, conserved TM helix